MKFSYYLLLILFVLSSCSRTPLTEITRANDYVYYSVDYQSADHNSMTVTLSVPILTHANNIFQFASTAPGTYQVMDIGRFIHDFKVFDSKGKELGHTKISTNQYKLYEPTKVRSIQYKVNETWDTKVDENRVYRMCGTSIEKDHLLFNAHCALGYFKGLQQMPIRLRLPVQDGWKVGTALKTDVSGNYMANSFDHLIDSPILMGRLSSVVTDVNGTAVEIYTYSKTDLIHSEQIMESMEAMLIASDKFLEGLPVDHYVFLFHFEGGDYGAWEHSYSSEYVYKEQEWDLMEESVMATASHEFFHVVTPLNIHSEIIEQFNFVNPTPSIHLWLYEGVTEWASDMILLHGGEIDIEEYLDRQQEKLIMDQEFYDRDYSLTELAMVSFTEEGHVEYGNIYYAGALIATLLDIRLIELSEGRQGLRELIIELANAYGPDLPFSEKDFFDEVVRRTHPSIEKFIAKHIKDYSRLPIEEYYNTIGIEYHPELTDSTKSGLGFVYIPAGPGLYLTSNPNNPKVGSLRAGDLISTIDGAPVNEHTIEDFLAEFEKLPVGTAYKADVFRGNRTVTVNCQTVMKTEPHVLIPLENPSSEQLMLRNKWMGL